MKYLNFVFENEEVNTLVDSQEDNINEITAYVIKNSIALEDYVKENLDQFVSSTSSLSDVYEAIKNFTIQETIKLIDI